MKTGTLKWFNCILFLIMVCVNFLAEYLPIGYGTTAEISGEYRSLFTPAGYSFSIWGIIYAFMLLFIIWQWTDSGIAGEMLSERIGFMFILSCLINISWVFAWHYKMIWLSALLIAGLLVSLAFIQKAFFSAPYTNGLTKVVRVGFDIYFGWIIAATIANISVFLVSVSWNGFGMPEEFWTCFILIAGTLIGVLPTVFSARFFTTLAVVWTYVGILAKFLADKNLHTRYPAAVTTAGTGIVIMLLVMTFVFIEAQSECCGYDDPAEYIRIAEKDTEII